MAVHNTASSSSSSFASLILNSPSVPPLRRYCLPLPLSRPPSESGDEADWGRVYEGGANSNTVTSSLCVLACSLSAFEGLRGSKKDMTASSPCNSEPTAISGLEGEVEVEDGEEEEERASERSGRGLEYGLRECTVDWIEVG